MSPYYEMRTRKMAGKSNSSSQRRNQLDTAESTTIKDVKKKYNKQINGKCTDSITSNFPKLSPVVRLLDTLGEVANDNKVGTNMAPEADLSSGLETCRTRAAAHGEESHEPVSTSVCEQLSCVSGTNAPHDVSDESGIEEPELFQNIPHSEGEGEQVTVATRRSSKVSVCSDSGSESPDASNTFPSPTPAMETCFYEQSVKIEEEPHVSDGDLDGCADNRERAASPSMPFLEPEMPILTMEMPMPMAKGPSRSATPTTPVSCVKIPTMPDSSESVGEEGLHMNVMSFEDAEVNTSAVSSTSDEYTPARNYFHIKTEAVDSCHNSNISNVLSRKKRVPSQQHSKDTRSQDTKQSKNFLTEFNKFIKKFDAKKVNYQRCKSENKTVVKKENIHKDQCYIGSLNQKSALNPKSSNPSFLDNPPKIYNPSGNPPKPLSTSNPPASPKRKSRVRPIMKICVGHVAPIYFTPQNLYEMFVNAYWMDHAMDHPTKEQVLRDADALWRQKYCKQKDPSRNEILRFLDRHEAKQSRQRQTSHLARRRSADMKPYSGKMGTSRRASVSSPVRARSIRASLSTRRRRTWLMKQRVSVDALAQTRCQTETNVHSKKDSAATAELGETKLASSTDSRPEGDSKRSTVSSILPRPKRRRVSNIRYDTDEFALGDMSELEELEAQQQRALVSPGDKTPSEVLVLSEREVAAVYRDWRPPADIDVPELLASFTLLLSLKRKVIELLQIVFPDLDYPGDLLSSVSTLLLTLDRIEAAVTDTQSADDVATVGSSNSVNTPCQVILCKQPKKCLCQLRKRVCHFLCVILPELRLDDAFDCESDSVEELLEQIIVSNKQAFQAHDSATWCEKHASSSQLSEEESRDKSEVS